MMIYKRQGIPALIFCLFSGFVRDKKMLLFFWCIHQVSSVVHMVHIVNLLVCFCTYRDLMYCVRVCINGEEYGKRKKIKKDFE